MSRGGSPWTERLGWCAFLLGGAALVTSGFEVAPSAAPTTSPEVMQTGGRLPAPHSSPDAGQSEKVGARSRTMNELTIQELEHRIQALEKQLAEKSAELTSSSPPDASPPSTAVPASQPVRVPTGAESDSAQTPGDARSERDIEIERETNERAQKMVSEMREQMRQLEMERARQMKEVIESSN